ncbi:MAG: hypothetical protein KDD53_04170 [Bdellovibrionales bacterium]|nr:hypothetical protein [Bdellovibrionales bacterium]
MIILTNKTIWSREPQTESFMKTVLFLLVLFSFAAAVISEAIADDFSHSLRKSMTQYDVLKMWGAPIEKEEFESKRQSAWVYQDTKIIFQEGRVAAWFSRSGESNESLPPVIEIEKPVATAELDDDSVVGEQDDAAVEEILKDILDEPAGDEDDGAGHRNFPPGRPQIIR